MTSHLQTQTFAERLATRDVTVGIVGLGYAGLPLALAFAEAGFDVTGHRPLRASASPPCASAARTSSTCPPSATTPSTAGSTATTDYAAVAELDALTICVPTPLSKTRTPGPLLRRARRPSRSPSTCARASSSILQSTTYPGTTEERRPADPRGERRQGRRGLLPRLRARARRPGQPQWTPAQHARSSSPASRDECRARTERSTRPIVDEVVPVSSTDGRRDGQAAREHLPRGQHRAGQRAGADVRPPRHLAPGRSSTPPRPSRSRFLPHYPGPGLGGDCIPVVPHFLSWRLREYGYSARLIDAAHEVNASMPLHVIQKISDALNDPGRADQGLADPAAGHGLQGRRPRHARVAEPARSCASSLAPRRRRPLLRPVGAAARARRPAATTSVDWCDEEVRAPTAS